MDNNFNSSPRPPRTPNARRSMAPINAGVHTPRTPYATVHKARMITSTIRRRRLQHQLEEVMTPHALRARQTLANTPARRARLGLGEDGIFQRISPREELRALSRVLAREKRVREKLVELNSKKELEENIQQTPPSKRLSSIPKSSTVRSEQYELDHVSGVLEEVEATPTRPSKSASGRLSEAHLIIESRSPSPEDIGQLSINRSLNLSQLDIELPRNDPFERLSLVNPNRLSEAFPEFDLTQREEGDEEVVEELPDTEFEVQRRKESNPFVIEVDDFEFPDTPRVPDEVGDFTTEERDLEVEPDVDMADFGTQTAGTVDTGHQLYDGTGPNSSIDNKLAGDGTANENNALGANLVTGQNEFTTQEDYEVYSHFVDETQDIDTDPAPFERREPGQNTLLKSLAGIASDPLLLENASAPAATKGVLASVETRRMRERLTIPSRIIKDFSASMTTRKLQPAALAELIEASEAFFEQAGADLAAYARHSKRKTIDTQDVLQLMRRQRTISSSLSPSLLAKQYLPQELVDEVNDATSKLVDF